MPFASDRMMMPNRCESISAWPMRRGGTWYVKAAEGKDRVFILAEQDFVAQEKGEPGQELVIRFEYRPATLTDWPENVREEKTAAGTEELTALAEKRLLALRDTSFAAWIAELALPYIKADGERADYSRLQAHMNRYVARNTFDYFIHKDLAHSCDASSISTSRTR